MSRSSVVDKFHGNCCGDSEELKEIHKLLLGEPYNLSQLWTQIYEVFCSDDRYLLMANLSEASTGLTITKNIIVKEKPRKFVSKAAKGYMAPLITVITKITNHIEVQNETIINENRKLQDENASLELQLQLLVQKNKEMNHDVEQLIDQNKEFRESLDMFKDENNRLRVKLKQQNKKLRLIIETLKLENVKLKADIDEGVKMLRWTNEKKKSNFWKNWCPSVQSKEYSQKQRY